MHIDTACTPAAGYVDRQSNRMQSDSGAAGGPPEHLGSGRTVFEVSELRILNSGTLGQLCRPKPVGLLARQLRRAASHVHTRALPDAGLPTQFIVTSAELLGFFGTFDRSGQEPVRIFV